MKDGTDQNDENPTTKGDLSFDYQEVSNTINDTTIAVSNLLEREFPAEYVAVDSARLIFMTRFRLVVNNYLALFYLCGDSPKDPTRDKRFILSVHPLVRSMFEELITFGFLLEDIPAHTDFLFQTIYKELRRERDFALNFHKGKQKWEDYADSLNQRLADIRASRNLTEDQADRIEKYPSVGRMKDIALKKNPKSKFFGKFYDFVKESMYRELSLSSHMDMQNLTERGLYFSKPLAKKLLGDKYREKLDNNLERHKSEVFFTAMTLLLAIMTEFDSAFKFHERYIVKLRLQMIWDKLIKYTDIAEDFYEIRYKDLIK